MEDSVISLGGEGSLEQGRWNRQWREPASVLVQGQMTGGLSFPVSSGEGVQAGGSVEVALFLLFPPRGGVPYSV